jgi:hypothetical protein
MQRPSSHDAPVPVQPAELYALAITIERIVPRLRAMDPLRAHLTLAWHEALTASCPSSREPRN